MRHGRWAMMTDSRDADSCGSYHESGPGHVNLTENARTTDLARTGASGENDHPYNAQIDPTAASDLAIDPRYNVRRNCRT